MKTMKTTKKLRENQEMCRGSVEEVRKPIRGSTKHNRSQTTTPNTEKLEKNGVKKGGNQEK